MKINWNFLGGGGGGSKEKTLRGFWNCTFICQHCSNNMQSSGTASTRLVYELLLSHLPQQLRLSHADGA